MPDTKISAAADAGTLLATDKVPLARSGSTTAYAGTMAEVSAYANSALPYSATTPIMDGFGAVGTAASVSRGDHVHPSDTTRAPLASPAFTGAPSGPTPTPATDSSTRLATTAFVQSAATAAAAPAFNDVGRNLLHNPLFNVQQRGAGPWTANGYTADRWVNSFVSDTISTSLLIASDAVRAAVGDEAAANFLQCNITGNAATGAYSSLQQTIEGVRRLGGKTITVSFWAVANSGTPKIGLNALQNFGNGGSPSAAAWALTTGMSVTLSTTWARYAVTFTLPSTAGKTLGTSGSDYTSIALAFSSGATNTALFGNIGVQSNTFSIWGMQLEIGSVATPLEKPDPQQDLAKCQRFYWTTNGTNSFVVNANSTGNNLAAYVAFPVTMRAAPTITYIPSAGNVSGNVIGIISGSVNNVGFSWTVQTNAAGYTYWVGNINASADL